MKSDGTRCETADASEVLRQSRRDRWAGRLAAGSTAIHFAAGFLVFAWYYFIVPRIKYNIEQAGGEVSNVAIVAIRQSDFIVNYSYLLLFIGPLLLVIDFRIGRWIAKEMGLRWASAFSICITIILLINIAFGQYILS